MRKNANHSIAAHFALVTAMLLFMNANVQAQEPPPATELLYARSADGTGDWTFHGGAGQTVVVTASSDDFDTVVELWSPAGELIAGNDDDDDDENGTDSRLQATLTADGPYRVNVHAWGFDSPAGTYEVAVHVLPQTTVVEPVVEVPDALSLFARGFLHRDGTGDWTFHGGAGQTVVVTASSDDFDTVVELWSPAGELIAGNDDDENGTDSRLQATLTADGPYRVNVQAWGFDNPGGAYEVAVRVVDSTRNPVSEPTTRPRDDDRVGNSSLPGRDMLPYIPPEATAVGFVDVDALVNSDIYRWIATSPLTRDLFREMQEDAGLELDDINRVIAGIDIDTGREIVVLMGRFDQNTLDALARQNRAVETHHGNRRVFRFDDDNAMAMLEPGVIVIGARPFVIRALDPPAHGDSIESNRRLLHLLSRIPHDSNLWGAGRFDDSGLHIAFGARLDDGVHGTLIIEPPDEAAAARLQTQIEMLRAMASLAATSHLELDLIDSFHVTAEDNAVTLSFAIPADLLLELLTAIDLAGFPEDGRIATAPAPFNRRMTHTG